MSHSMFRLFAILFIFGGAAVVYAIRVYGPLGADFYPFLLWAAISFGLVLRLAFGREGERAEGD